MAAACHLPASAITDVLPQWFASRAAACDDLAASGRLQPGDAGCLAALTGVTEAVPCSALPALAGTSDGRPPVRATRACWRCAARTGCNGPVPVHLPAHQKACARHRIWTGRAIQADLASAPDIIRACQHAWRLARWHGITWLVLAETTARQQANDAAHNRAMVSQRAAALAASNGVDPEDPDIAEAARYPETIARAAVILRSAARPGGPE